jgi:hypothetical protein
MKIALRYGLSITLVVVLWVVIARFLIGVESGSTADLVASVLFNVAAIVSIYLGTKARKNELEGALTFKEGVRTGFSIALVYAASACLFFAGVLLVKGPGLLLSESGAEGLPLWRVAVQAFAGLFFLGLFFGIVYSTVISFFLAQRRKAG